MCGVLLLDKLRRRLELHALGVIVELLSHLEGVNPTQYSAEVVNTLPCIITQLLFSP